MGQPCSGSGLTLAWVTSWVARSMMATAPRPGKRLASAIAQTGLLACEAS